MSLSFDHRLQNQAAMLGVDNKQQKTQLRTQRSHLPRPPNNTTTAKKGQRGNSSLLPDNSRPASQNYKQDPAPSFDKIQSNVMHSTESPYFVNQSELNSVNRQQISNHQIKQTILSGFNSLKSSVKNGKNSDNES